MNYGMDQYPDMTSLLSRTQLETFGMWTKRKYAKQAYGHPQVMWMTSGSIQLHTKH